MNIPFFSLLCAVTTALLLLSGCTNPIEAAVPTSLPAVVEPAETEIAAVSPENQEVQELVETFSQLYFARDREAMKAYLAEDYGSLIDASPYAGDTVVIQGYKLPQSVTYELAASGSCWASVAFRETPESDSYTYLSITLVKERDAWKIESYGLEK